ncbi:MAG: antibiotic biosynthesis monooxygenase [Frankiaceae bacterium]
MYARVTHASFPADRLDESKQVVADQMKEIRANEGNRGYLLLTDPGTGKSMVVSLWEDEAAMRASEQQADRVRDGVARPTNANVTGVDRFEVAIADLNS